MRSSTLFNGQLNRPMLDIYLGTIIHLCMKTSVMLIAVICLLCGGSYCHAQAMGLGKITYKGVDHFGIPLGWDGKRIALMDSAGRLIFVPAKDMSDVKMVASEFRAYTPAQIRKSLLNEFGDRYDVSVTDRYVVVHPWGSSSSYARPFELLHDRFVNLVESHGVKLQKPKVPLVAAVLRSRNDFNRTLFNEIQIKDQRVNGYYSSQTNRITSYDKSGYIRKANDPWIFGASQIVHEAAHQSAFNTGLHNRFAPPPKWMSEGLATLFEARGFMDPKKFPKQIQRINNSRIKHLRRKIAEGQLYALLLNLIDNDRIFQTDIETAYALSWGLSFYLYESAPKRYFQFLANDAKRKNFKPYTSSQRLKSFALAFGNDFEKLAKKMNEFYMANQ